MNILHFDTFYFSSKNQKIIISATVYFEEEKGVLSVGEIEDKKNQFCFKARRQGSDIMPKEIKLVKFYFPKLQPK